MRCPSQRLRWLFRICGTRPVATYAVGDIQGCCAELQDLLSQVAFGADDSLWVLGDLVNRGPASLATLRLLYSMRGQVRIVLGNHDLHLLAVALGGHKVGRSDTFAEVFAADDVDELLQWLRVQPLMVREGQYTMTHAGVPHIWSLDAAQGYADEVSQVLRGGDYRSYFEQLYGNVPDCWDEALTGMDRLRMITNYFTRMRLIDRNGRLDFKHKGHPDSAPDAWQPWYQLRPTTSDTLLFGHWAAIEGETGRTDLRALDTGCVWGRSLTALELGAERLHSVPARSR